MPVAAAQDPHPFDLLSSVAVDGDGHVVGSDPIDHGTLRVWEDGEWRPWNLRDRFRNWSPVRVLSLANGNLASLWHRDVDKWMVVWSRGKKILGEACFSLGASSVGDLFWSEAADGALWLSARSPIVIEMKPPDAAGQTAACARNWDLRPWMENPGASSWHPVHVVSDDTGGIWLWSYPETSSKTDGRLPGLLHRPSGSETWRPGPALPEGSEPPIGFVGKGPAGTLWIGDDRGRLLAMSPNDSQMREFFPPPPHRLIDLVATWPDRQGGIFVLAGSSWMPGLWQWNESGWHTLVPQEKFPFTEQFRTRQSLLELPEGLLLGSREGLIWLPREEQAGRISPWGEARLLDWKTGFPLVRVEQILGLPDKGLGVRASRESGRRWWAGTLEGLLVEGKRLKQAEEIRPHRGWAVDAGDRVYTLLNKRPENLQEWTNGVWRDIPLPDGVNTSRFSLLDVDARQRIVVLSYEADESVLLLESDRKTWRVFPDYFSALVEMGDDAAGLWNWSCEWRPTIAPNGSIAFLDRPTALHLWDGDTWQRWEVKDFFTPARLASDPPMDSQRPWLQDPKRRIAAERFGTPFVSRDGRIAINTLYSNSTWFWGAAGDWEPGAKEPGPNDPLLNPPSNIRHNRAPREARFSGRVRSVAEDNLGTVWIVAGGNLHRYRDKRTATIFEEGEVHPFLSEPSLEEVRVDRNGFVWLRTKTFDHVLLHPPPKPEFHLRIIRDKNGLASFEGSPPGRLEWSTDRENWFPVRENVFGFVPPDIREISLRLIAEDLSIHLLPEQEIPAFQNERNFWEQIIAILSEGDHEEKVLALQACERHPDAALPFLRSALRKSRDADDWWLRAALQAVGRSSGVPAR